MTKTRKKEVTGYRDILNAYLEGKYIQVRDHSNEKWRHLNEGMGYAGWNFSKWEYRIDPNQTSDEKKDKDD